MKRIVVLGAGESGVGSAILALKKGFEVFVSDSSAIKDKYKEEMDKYQIQYEEKQHTEEKILNADEIIKSPGIPEKAPIIQKLRAKGTHIISEIEFAGRYSGDSVKICITGSNGKTTTTTLIHHILTQAGLDASLAGNVGFSLARQVAIEPHKYYVIELSSFQLDGMYDFEANIAILLNITPDHLDRYEYKFQNYIDAKMRIVQNMTPDDCFIYWTGDPIVEKEIAKRDIKARMLPFGDAPKEGLAAYLNGDKYIIDINKNDRLEMDEEKIGIQGKHNMYNSMAAGVASYVSGISNDKIRQALSNFQGVEHRLESVAKVRNVLFVNDSKATNVNSTWYALQSMKTPVVLILGGKDKGNDYTEIEELVKEKVRALVFLGVDNDKLHKFFDGMKPNCDARSMKEAVDKSFQYAEKGDTVLLSPCCASFDLFNSYEDRGEQFKQVVKDL
jgi:UDP-N-acetylmuramoylalanine--D-glutamate ligase